MAEIITFYHGTIHSFDEADISFGKPYKDFGTGFYVSGEREHAQRMALRNRDIELFFAGAYGDIKSDIAIARLIEQLMPEKLPRQYFFGSKKSVVLLSFKSREVLL